MSSQPTTKAMKTVPGTAKVFAIETRQPWDWRYLGTGPRVEYVLTHKPTGAAVGAFRCRVDAEAFAAELFVKVPKDEWQEADGKALQRKLAHLTKWVESRVKELNESRGEA